MLGSDRLCLSRSPKRLANKRSPRDGCKNILKERRSTNEIMAIVGDVHINACE